MRLVILGIVSGGILAAAQTAAAQTGQTAPPPVPAPVAAPIVYPAAPPPKLKGKERLAAPAVNPGAWFSTEDYPAESLRNEEQGTTMFRLAVSPEGIPTDCAITGSSGSNVLDQQACRLLMQRARFVPALDPKGKPTAGSWSSRFKWVLPERELRPAPVAKTETMTFTIEKDGSATDCSRTDGGVMPCGKGQVFEPVLDASGNPVRRRVTMSYTASVVDPDLPPAPVVTVPATKAQPTVSTGSPRRRRP